MGKHRLFELRERPIHDTPERNGQKGARLESQMLKSDRAESREKRGGEKKTALLFTISSYFIACAS